MLARGARHLRDVVAHVGADVDLAHGALERQHLVRRGDGPQLGEQVVLPAAAAGCR